MFPSKIIFATLVGLSCGLPNPQPNPNTYENIDISDLFINERPENGTVEGVSFLLSGKNATNLRCNASSPGFPSPVFICGDSKYRFALYPGDETQYALRIYHELGTAFGFYGSGDVFTYCHAGGLGALACTQQYPVTIVIDSGMNVD